MTTTIERHVDIAADPASVFDLIADLHDYGWLASEGDYEGTSEISPPPVAVGTTYVEHSRRGVRRGRVTALDRPTRIAFHQPMALRPRIAGTIDSTVTMAVTAVPDGAGARVTRTVELGIPRRLAVVRRLIVTRYTRETERMLHALKAAAER